MQIRQKASAMTDKKAVLFKQTLPSRFISFSKIQKNYHIHIPLQRDIINSYYQKRKVCIAF